MTPQSMLYSSSAALKSNSFPRVGYTFAGWATTAEGSVAYANGADYTMGTTDQTLYAKWHNPASPIIISAILEGGISVFGAVNVPSTATFIDIVFDQDMGNGYSINRFDPNMFPEASWINLRTIRIRFQFWGTSNYGLTPNFDHGLFLNFEGYQNFKSSNGIPLENTVLTFRTGE